jgi:RHH-type rel operon transcriptional repressor/antitoxin RelB
MVLEVLSSALKRINVSEITARMTFDLPLTVKERLQKLTRTTAKSEARLAAEAISSFLDLQEWQNAEIERAVREADTEEFASDEEVASVFARWSAG